MKYTPSHQGFVFEPLTTANKNIQSYFMKNEQSFYTKEEFKYPNYGSSEKSLIFLIENDFIFMNNIKFEIDFFTDYDLNLKYKTFQNCIDCIYSFLYEKIKKENNFKDISQVVLIFGDFFGRSFLMSFIDIFLNYLNFKSIILLPISLSMSFSLNQNFSGFVYKNGITFIDDFAQLDVFFNGKKPVVKLEDEDFAEEFSRNNSDNKLKYNCQECGQKEESLEKIENHIFKEHETGEYFYYNEEEPENIIEKVKNKLMFLFSREKANKILSNMNYISNSKNIEEYNFIDENEYYEIACKGALLFIGLEISKELWMTDYEWRSVRLRALKEKLLFYI